MFTGLYPSGESMCRLPTVAARGAVSGLGAGWIRISSGGFCEPQCIVSSWANFRDDSAESLHHIATC